MNPYDTITTLCHVEPLRACVDSSNESPGTFLASLMSLCLSLAQIRTTPLP